MKITPDAKLCTEITVPGSTLPLASAKAAEAAQVIYPDSPCESAVTVQVDQQVTFSTKGATYTVTVKEGGIPFWEIAYPDGDQYKGELNTSHQAHGKGFLRQADKTITVGVWFNDVLQTLQDVTFDVDSLYV